MSRSSMQSIVDNDQDATVIHGGRVVRNGVLNYLRERDARGDVPCKTFCCDPIDSEDLIVKARATVVAMLSSGVASFSWPKSGLGVDPETRALEWPQIPESEIRDALNCELPYERCCVEVSVTRDGASNTIFWNLMRTENGWDWFSAHLQDEVVAVPTVAMRFDRTKLDDRGMPVYQYLYLPPSFDKYYHRREVEQQMDMILRFLRALRHESVKIDETRPSRLRRARQSGKGGEPLDVHRIVHIDMDQVGYQNRPHLGGTHASPIEHRRRGHDRTLKSGRVVPVRESIVNRRHPNSSPPIPAYILRHRRPQHESDAVKPVL